MCTAQSDRPASPNSRVLSSGSTIQARSAANRTGSSLLSSGEYRVGGPQPGELRGQKLMGRPVACLAQVVSPAAVGPQLQQTLPSRYGQLPCALVVTNSHAGHRAGSAGAAGRQSPSVNIFREQPGLRRCRGEGSRVLI